MLINGLKIKLNKLTLRKYWNTFTVLGMVHFLYSIEYIFYLIMQQQLFGVNQAQ